MSKIVYLYDESTGEFAGEYKAQASPLEPGAYITPTASTDIEPLPHKAGFAVCLIKNAWQYKTDVRGGWFKPNGEKVEAGDLSSTVPTTWSRTAPAPTLAELKTAKKAEITANFERSIQQTTIGCPPNEIASWPKQEQEARAFTALPLSPTPLIDALASARNVSKVALASRIIAKADLFAGISGQLIGKRQGLEDAIDAAISKTALAAIVW